MILKWLSKFWPIFIIIILCGLVAWKNVLPGTYLTGWDNLHPEFDFKTNIIDRGIKGVWQYYQGLGVPSGNAHVADLPRQIILWIASWVVPQNLIRYDYHLTAWLGGGIGIYILLLKMLVGEIGYRKKQVVALVGSIFYLFNLGTMQNFYAPYESFSHFYLMLPWLIYVFLSYLQVGRKKQLLWLVLVNILAVPVSYIPTIFIVYMLVVGIMGLNELIASRLRNWKRLLVGGVVILIVNSFWLLPFVHFVMNNTKGVVDAKINRMFTQEAFLRNEEYGDLKHSLVMKGFWFDTTDMTRIEGQHDFMMRPWSDYLDKPGIMDFMYALVSIVAMGYMYALISKKRSVSIFLGITIVGLFALINTNWPTGEFFKYLQVKLPLFAQVMRFPFTKFIFLVIIGYSVGIAWFMEMIFKYFKWIRYGLAIMIVGTILWVQRPAFEGHLFYDNLRLKIPEEYFELFKFFQNEDRFRGRVANLPQPTFWGWTTYGWGYRGSGFPWYGIPQPILDRNFDVWSPESEKYYEELNNAIYDNESQEYFLSVLNKYGVDYVWVDGWVINSQKPAMLDVSHVERWLGDGGYSLVFGIGKQRVYKRNAMMTQEGNVENSGGNYWSGYPSVKIDKSVMGANDFLREGSEVYSAADLPKFVANKGGQIVYGYALNDMRYISLKNPRLGEAYLFSDQLSNLKFDPRTWWMKEIYIAYTSVKGAKVNVCMKKIGSNDCFYIGSDENENGGYRWGRFAMANTTSPNEIVYEINGDVEMRELRFGYFDVPSSELSLDEINNNGDNDITVDLTDKEVLPNNCYLFGKGLFNRQVMNENGNYFVRYSANDSSSCESRMIANSDIVASGGTISLNTRNVSGRPIKFCLRHDPPGDCLVEEIVSGERNKWVNNTYSIPPVTKVGDLYLEIDDYAVGKENRVNDVGKVVISGAQYKRHVNIKLDNIITNNQAYRGGWIGLDAKSWKVLEHVKVDGWANGWLIDGSGEITIFYWPQLLEYLGFAMLGMTVMLLVIKRK